MGDLRVKDVNADLSLLAGSLKNSNRLIPSFVQIAKRAVIIPLIAVASSFLSVVVFYMSLMADREKSIGNFLSFFMSEGWYAVTATLIVSAIFFVMSYTNITLYMMLPNEMHEKSHTLFHLRKVMKKLVSGFVICLIFSTLLTYTLPPFVFAVPAFTLAFIFIFNLTLSAEINRLGMGPALEKVSNLLSKI